MLGVQQGVGPRVFSVAAAAAAAAGLPSAHSSQATHALDETELPVGLVLYGLDNFLYWWERNECGIRQTGSRLGYTVYNQ